MATVVWLLAVACGTERPIAPSLPEPVPLSPPGACAGYDTEWSAEELPQTRYGDVAIRPCERLNYMFRPFAYRTTVSRSNDPLIVVPMAGWDPAAGTLRAELAFLPVPSQDATVLRLEDVVAFKGTSLSYPVAIGMEPPSDLDGDGWDDLLVEPDLGFEWLVSGPFSGDFDIDERSNRLYMGEMAEWGFGFEPRIVGDVTEDGSPEVAVSLGGGAIGVPGTGAVALVTGPIEEDVDLTTWPLVVYGAGSSQGGRSPVASGPFDANADGVADLVIGGRCAPGCGENAVRVHFGPIGSAVDTDDADVVMAQFSYIASKGGNVKWDATGGWQDPAGDLNGDGHDDLAVTNPYRDFADAPYGGIVWLMDGPMEGELDLDGEAMARVRGTSENELLPHQMALGGDLDGDGSLDLVLGISPDGTGNKGAILPVDPGMRLFFGPFAGTIGFLDGVEFYPRGFLGANAALDLDSDGISDLILFDNDMGSDDKGASADNRINSGLHLWLSSRSMEWPRPWAPIDDP